MDAESREAVFEALREKGIKAIKVVAADGSKANGEIRGVRKRFVVVFAIGAALFAGIAVFFFSRGMGQDEQDAPIEVKLRIADALPRQSVLGNRVRIDSEKVEAFALKAERFLAKFAEPGRSYFAPESDWPSDADFDVALTNLLMLADSDYTETVDLKRIVTAMKIEMRSYLGGGGSAASYIRELIKRQDLEISYREKAQKRLRSLIGEKKAGRAAYDYWLKANAQLQGLGINQLVLPEELRDYRPSFDLDE